MVRNKKFGKIRLGMNVYTEEPNILNENDKCFFMKSIATLLTFFNRKDIDCVV